MRLRDELEPVREMPEDTAAEIRAKLREVAELSERVGRDGDREDQRFLHHISEGLHMVTEEDLRKLEEDQRNGSLFTRAEMRSIREGTADPELLGRYRRHYETAR